MKFAIVLFAVLATAFAAPSESNELTTSEEQFVENFIKNYGSELDRYFKSSMKELAEKICTDKNTDFAGPMEEVIKRAAEVNHESLTVCNCVQTNLYHVLEPMINAIDGCLPNQEAGIAAFTVKAIISVISHACQATGEQILELINPCLDDVEVKEKCVENAEEKWSNFISSGDKSFKDLACSEYTDVRPCFETAVAEKCKLEITKQSVMGLLDSIFQSPCTA